MMADCWISIADRRPADGYQEVWAYDAEEGVTIATYCRGKWHDVYGDRDGLGSGGCLFRVTHWMPMARPEPPGA